MPNSKIATSGLSGALVVVLVWAASTMWKVTIPPEISAALTVIVSTLVGYFVPDLNGKSGPNPKTSP